MGVVGRDVAGEDDRREVEENDDEEGDWRCPLRDIEVGVFTWPRCRCDIKGGERGLGAEDAVEDLTGGAAVSG